MDTTMIIGIAASVLTAVSLSPQLIKLLREKQAKDVSYFMLAFLFAGLGFWVVYGIMIKDPIIQISNAFSFSVNLVLAWFTFKYKHNHA